MSTNSQPQTITLFVSLGANALPAEVNHATTQLYRELLASPADRVEKPRPASLEAGAKGDPLTLGAIALALGVAAAPGVLAIVQDWLNRRHAQPVQVKIKLGEDELELTGPATLSAAELESRAERLIAMLQRQRPEA